MSVQQSRLYCYKNPASSAIIQSGTRELIPSCSYTSLLLCIGKALQEADSSLGPTMLCRSSLDRTQRILNDVLCVSRI